MKILITLVIVQSSLLLIILIKKLSGVDKNILSNLNLDFVAFSAIIAAITSLISFFALRQTNRLQKQANTHVIQAHLPILHVEDGVPFVGDEEGEFMYLRTHGAGEVIIKVKNIGLGLAKNIKFTWNIDFDILDKINKSLGEERYRVENSEDGSKKFFLGNGHPVELEHSMSSKCDFLMSVQNNKDAEFQLVFPAVPQLLVCRLIEDECSDSTENKIFSELDVKLKIEYKDVFGTVFESVYIVEISAFRISESETWGYIGLELVKENLREKIA